MWRYLPSVNAPPYHRHSVFRIFLLWCVLLAFSLSTTVVEAARGGMVKDGWVERIETGIFKVADTDFEEGLAIFDAYINAYPKEPEGYFFYAVGVQEKMQKLNDLSDFARFNRYADKVKRLARKRLSSDNNDHVARMYLGAIHGYSGLLDAKRRNLVRAFFHAIKAKSHLEKVYEARRDLPDTAFGLGMVYYFASRKSQEEGGILAWTIRRFITNGIDMRHEGIRLITEATTEDALSRDYALAALMWIHLYDHRYADAQKLALDLSRRFAHDILSLWVLSRVALVNHNCGEAEQRLTEIEAINRAQDQPEDKYVDVTVARKMARLCSAMEERRYADAGKLNDSIGRWLEDKPVAVIEYQDEKNLIAYWKSEHRRVHKKLSFIRSR